MAFHFLFHCTLCPRLVHIKKWPSRAKKCTIGYPWAGEIAFVVKLNQEKQKHKINIDLLFSALEIKVWSI